MLDSSCLEGVPATGQGAAAIASTRRPPHGTPTRWSSPRLVRPGCRSRGATPSRRPSSDAGTHGMLRPRAARRRRPRACRPLTRPPGRWAHRHHLPLCCSRPLPFLESLSHYGYWMQPGHLNQIPSSSVSAGKGTAALPSPSSHGTAPPIPAPCRVGCLLQPRLWLRASPDPFAFPRTRCWCRSRPASLPEPVCSGAGAATHVVRR